MAYRDAIHTELASLTPEPLPTPYLMRRCGAGRDKLASLVELLRSAARLEVLAGLGELLAGVPGRRLG
jgi:hypothetical protein